MNHAHHAGGSPFDDAQLVAVIGAEGEAARDLTAAAIDRACAALGWADRTRVARIADLGAGPGVAACALAAAFPAATVAAVDSSPAMRAAAVRRAEAAGVAGRFECVALGLDDEDLTALGALDLAWAALSLHHLRDAPATLGRVAAQLRPGGALCVLERHTPLQLRPADELDRPGLWERVDAAQSVWYQRARASQHGHSGLDQLAGQVAAAGLVVADAGVIEGTTTLPALDERELLVSRHIGMALHTFGGVLDPADLAALRDPDAPARLAGSAVAFTATRLLVVAAAR